MILPLQPGEARVNLLEKAVEAALEDLSVIHGRVVPGPTEHARSEKRLQFFRHRPWRLPIPMAKDEPVADLRRLVGHFGTGIAHDQVLIVDQDLAVAKTVIQRLGRPKRLRHSFGSSVRFPIKLVPFGVRRAAESKSSITQRVDSLCRHPDLLLNLTWAAYGRSHLT